jgi:putative transposase
MTSPNERTQIIGLVRACIAQGARQTKACGVIDLSARTLQRWERDRGLDEPLGDLRRARVQAPANQLSEAERERLLVVVNSAEFADMPPSQIVPRLADRGEYIGSESTVYRTLRACRQLAHRCSQRPSKTRYKPRALVATAPRQLFS